MATFAKSSTASLIFTATSRAAGASTASLIFTATSSVNAIRQASSSAKISFGLQSDVLRQLSGPSGALRTVLSSFRARRHPFNFAEVPNSVVLLTNGIDPMLFWDATARSIEVAGVPAPVGAPSIAAVVGTPSTSFIFVVVRFLDRYGNVSDFSTISQGTLGAVPIISVSYADVPLPSGPNAGKVYRRQILRTTVGQASVFYVDIDTLDLTSTSFTSFVNDDEILGNEPVPLFDDQGAIFGSTHGFPPSHKLAAVQHLGRVFAAGEVVYDDGHVEVTSDSLVVRGVGTQWPVSFIGRLLYVVGAPRPYEIAEVDIANQTLTLAEVYRGSTNLFAFYGIRAAPFERRLVYYTPAGLAMSWPAFYALSMQEDGDEITGLMSLSSFLYVLERRHMYRLIFKDNPATDGAVFLDSLRGCLNQRCWVQVEGVAYILDEQGIYSINNGVSEPISGPIQDLFRTDTPSPLKVNWEADTRFWHAAYSEVYGTIRFFVAMTGCLYPRHAICYSYQQDRWWIEEYHRPICCSTRMNLGVARVLAGVDHREMIALNVGYADGVPGNEVVLRGLVTGVTPTSVDCPLGANFSPNGANLALFLVSGRGKGQCRRIVEFDSPRFELLTPWLIQPAVGDQCVVAGIDWKWRGGWFRFVDDTELDNQRDVELSYQPNTVGTMDLQLTYNHLNVPRTWEVNRDGAALVSVGSPDVVVDLTNPSGWAVMRLEGHNERYSDGDHYVSPRLSGIQVQEPVRVYQVSLSGVKEER